MWAWVRRLLQWLPLVAAACWSCYPALLTIWAMGTIPALTLPAAEWREPGQTLPLRRRIQRHFLGHSIYLPLEDIATLPPTGAAADDPYLLMQKACGQGKLLLWLPFKFNVPIVGEKVIEWCWKPQTKDV